MTEDAPAPPGPTSVSVSITIAPLDHIAGDVAGLVGNFLFDLLRAVSLPREVLAKVNLMVIELVTNVMEQCSTRDEPLHVELRLEGDELQVTATPAEGEREFDEERERFEVIASAEDPNALLADTVHRRRVDRPKGGLGLIRLSETHPTTKKPPSGSGGDGGDSALL